ncbi:MAG: antitoxin AF2212-like protein [Pyrinomonadaceae bacterium]
MQTKLRATYENGVFVPISKNGIKDLPEAAEVEITVETLIGNGSDDSERQTARKLEEIAESMRTNTFAGNPPHFSREELHERR